MMRANKTAVLELNYKGLNRQTDVAAQTIAKSLGGRDDGTGFCFLTHRRDLNFKFKSHKAAEYAAGVLKSNLPKKVHISMWLPCDYEFSLESLISMRDIR
jgi:hypothetical protein